MILSRRSPCYEDVALVADVTENKDKLEDDPKFVFKLR